VKSALEQLEILNRGIEEIVPQDELLKKLDKSVSTGVPLNIKLGVDPTAPDVHLGFTVVMRKLRKFQDLGHQVILIIGDYTATVGDPSGKNKTRPRLSHAEVLENAKTYQEQFFQIVDREKTKVVFNGDWFSKMNFGEVTHLLSQITVAQMLERQDFQNRYSSGQPISLHEFIYPLMQGYDSLMIKADVEIGGTDQKFNVLRGRELQKHEDQDAQIGLFMPILLGTCGKEKMSKSLGNYIGLNESAQSMYHKVYKIPDALIANWFELLTDIPMQEIDALTAAIQAGSKNPNEAKSELALNIVSQYHGEAAAQQAKIAESKIHSGGAIPEDAPEFSIAEEELPLLTLLQKVGAFSSNGEAKRMIQNGGVKFNQEKVADFKAMVHIVPQSVVQVGKRKFYKINY
jgi:tyrosyl-tRNA synthetase